MAGQKEYQALATQTRFGLVGAQFVYPPENPYPFQKDQGGVISDLLNKTVAALLTQAGQKLWLGDPSTYEVAPYDKFAGKKPAAV